MRLLIHAPNVHQGGGRRLLTALLSGAPSTVHATVDARLRLPPSVSESVIVTRVAPGLVARLAAEWRLRTWARPDDVVLCFGNLPPLFGTPARVVLFLQNRYVVGPHSTRGLPLSMRVRIGIERAWLRARVRGAGTVVVQTPSMAREVEHVLRVTPVILPFLPEDLLEVPSAVEAKPKAQIDFLYVSSGEPHKNHLNLIAAWKLLASEGLSPSLTITVSCERYPALCAAMEEARVAGAKIENVGTVEPPVIDALYERSAAVIYPSRFESLGLPLLEARAHGLPILAAELDYARDVLDPVESFNPESPMSIARAVKRFCDRAESRQRMLTPMEFLEAVATLNGAPQTVE